MGLLDYVEYECDCPKCGAKVRGFQTKSGRRVQETVKPWMVDNFYTSCRTCGAWIEFTRNKPLPPPDEPPGWRDDYMMTVTPGQRPAGVRADHVVEEPPERPADGG